MLTREEILARKTLPIVEVSVPEWGEGATVFVRTITALERDRYEGGLPDDPDERLHNFRARYVALTACDEKGGRLFVDGDVDPLGELSGATLDCIYQAASTLNKMHGKAAELADADFAIAPADDSSIDLPSNSE